MESVSPDASSRGQGCHRVWQLIVLAIAIALVVARPLALGVEVTVQTTACDGSVGFSSFDTTDLHKIQAGDCVDPATGNLLQQVLIQSRDPVIGYHVLWVTGEEARRLMEQVRRVGDAHLERLAGPKLSIDSRTVIEHKGAPAASDRTAPPLAESSEPETAPDLPAPVINLLDPPVSPTRSMTSVITAGQTDARTVVGRIDAPAGLVSLTLNGRALAVDDSGMFKADVPLQADTTPVTLRAVDRQGKQGILEFRLLPRTEKDVAAAGKLHMDSDVFGNYHALIIANNQYSSLDDLNTPGNDADALAGLLQERYGFDIVRLNDATRYQILSALNDLRRDLTENDNLLIYYAGHGEYDKTNNRGHWLPVDAEHDSSANWISTIAITDIINAMSAKHVLVIADSCYSGALTRSVQTHLDPNLSPELRRQWLQTIAQTRSRYVMTSGGVKPVLDDGGNGHSVFANALLAALDENDGVIESSELFREVKQRVAIRAQELQIQTVPEYAPLKNTGHEFGEFLLVRAP